jgi:hypothetical protein
MLQDTDKAWGLPRAFFKGDIYVIFTNGFNAYHTSSSQCDILLLVITGVEYTKVLSERGDRQDHSAADCNLCIIGQCFKQLHHGFLLSCPGRFINIQLEYDEKTLQHV